MTCTFRKVFGLKEEEFVAAVVFSCRAPDRGSPTGTRTAPDENQRKSKMSGDKVLLVLRADANALATMQAALRAALQAVRPLQLSAGAGLWIGAVVEGFLALKKRPYMM